MHSEKTNKQTKKKQKTKKKKKKKPTVGVELIVGGDPHRSEKPGWRAGGMRQLNKKKKKHRYLVSPTGVLLLVFFDLFKVSKNTKKKPSKEQPSKENDMTCSKSAK